MDFLWHTFSQGDFPCKPGECAVDPSWVGHPVHTEIDLAHGRSNPERPARFRKWRSHKNPKILRSWTCHKVIHLIPEPFLGMVGPCRRYHMFTKHLHIFHLLSGQIGQVSDKPAGWGRGAALSGMNVLPTADLWWCFVVHFVAYEADFIHADSWVNKWKLISRGSFDSWYKLQAARKPGLYLVIKL